MPLLETEDVSSAPIVVHGRTCTTVARVHRIRLAGGGLGVYRVRARPSHVEVIEPDGRRGEIPIRDLTGRIVLATRVVVAVAVVVSAARARRHRAGRSRR